MSSFIQAQKDIFNNQVIQLLFNEEEYTCFSTTPWGIKVAQVKNSFRRSQEEAFFSINPMDKIKTRSDSAVVKYRNILVEMDKMPLGDQDQYITEIGMPYSTAVFSGSKSIHYIISLEEELSDEYTYRSLVKCVYKAVGEDLVDKSCKNPSRFSRLPGHIRGDTGKEQQLLTVKLRVPNSVLLEWLKSRGVTFEEEWTDLTQARSTFKNPSRLYSSTKNFLISGAPEGEWNINLFKAAANMWGCGYEEDDILNELLNVTGTLDSSDRKTIESAIKKASSQK
jgi:hypothetical protein